MMIKLQDYTIEFMDSSFLPLKGQLAAAQYSKIFVLVDTNTKQHCLPILQKALGNFDLTIISIEAGEVHKNISTCQIIWNALMQQQADRKAVLLNLGGGVIGDMGGFCASTYKRGIDFIQIPTTLLAQVDASIGGKLGIDFARVKNSIGLFKNPKGVYLLTNFFQTLPKEELYSGFGEVIKHALIVDSSYWQELLSFQDLESIDWKVIIERSLQVKKQIVEQDPLEQGIRKSLNFGHTIGHAVESLSWESKRPLLHGEAVALGMVVESFLSYKLLDFPLADLEVIGRYVLQLYPKYDLSLLNIQEVLDLIRQDKKNEDSQICFTMLNQVGCFQINVHAEDGLIVEALDYYTNL